jgi:N-terminal domain on NACHT_NTPase and P-loop NTPases
MEVAGGVLGIVSLLVQVSDKIEALRAFWKSFKDAPHDVADIIEGLEQLQELFRERAMNMPVPSKTLLDVIARVDGKIMPLENLARELDDSFKSPRRVTRMWAAYRTAKKDVQIKKFREALMEAKTDLILANQMILEYVTRPGTRFHYCVSD